MLKFSLVIRTCFLILAFSHSLTANAFINWSDARYSRDGVTGTPSIILYNQRQFNISDQIPSGNWRSSGGLLRVACGPRSWFRYGEACQLQWPTAESTYDRLTESATVEPCATRIEIRDPNDVATLWASLHVPVVSVSIPNLALSNQAPTSQSALRKEWIQGPPETSPFSTRHFLPGNTTSILRCTIKQDPNDTSTCEFELYQACFSQH